MRDLAWIVKELDDVYFSVLRAVEKGIERFEVVPVEFIASTANLSEDKTSSLLKTLHSYGLVWAPMGRERGYVLNFKGLDALALRSMSRRGILSYIGGRLGVGKEADVYEALTGEERLAAVKFYRIGRPSMKKFRRYRQVGIDYSSYLSASKATAKREIEALEVLAGRGLAVPTPIYRNRHVVVTSKIEGEELAKVKSLRSPTKVLRLVMDNVRCAAEAGVVHCDLSAYNVLVTSDESVLIIDWPQWVTPNHPMARSYLERDIKNIVDFFRRRMHLPIIYEDFSYIIEELHGTKKFNI